MGSKVSTYHSIDDINSRNLYVKVAVMRQHIALANLQSGDSLRPLVSHSHLFHELIAELSHPATELASHQITVNAYAPGFIQTPMSA